MCQCALPNPRNPQIPLAFPLSDSRSSDHDAAALWPARGFKLQAPPGGGTRPARARRFPKFRPRRPGEFPLTPGRIGKQGMPVSGLGLGRKKRDSESYGMGVPGAGDLGPGPGPRQRSTRSRLAERQLAQHSLGAAHWHRDTVTASEGHRPRPRPASSLGPGPTERTRVPSCLHRKSVRRRCLR